VNTEQWWSCYDDGWKGLIVDEAFSHPAKMARGLVYRIVREGLARGWWDKSTTIVDPFGGIGSTGIACAAHGIPSVLCELEQKFVDLAKQNFALHEREWSLMGIPMPTIVQGDSRRLASVVGPVVGASVTSPPYEKSQGHPAIGNVNADDWGNEGTSITKRRGLSGDYGDTPGQIGSVTSPPYMGGGHHADQTGAWNTNGRGQGGTKDLAGYGSTPGQIGALTSPPFAQPETRDRHPVQDGSVADAMTRAHTVDRQTESDGNIAALSGITSPPYANRVDDHGTDKPEYVNVGEKGKYGESDGQMGNLRLASVTSPPWENNEPTRDDNFRYTDGSPLGSSGDHYGTSEGQIGTEAKESYWTACEQVYRELWALFPPGGVLACVVKSFVRDKKLVDLPQMTLDLLQHIGFEPVAWIDAMLTAEHAQTSMLDEVPEYRKKRVSFFRRLAEKKGSPVINAEVVLVVRKPGTGGGVASVTSPPFMESLSDHPSKAIIASGLRMGASSMGDGYGRTEGQIGAMKEGPL